MKKVFEAKIELPVEFSSGNQIEHGKGRIYRSKKYHTYHDYLKASLEDVLDEVAYELNGGNVDSKNIYSLKLFSYISYVIERLNECKI